MNQLIPEYGNVDNIQAVCSCALPFPKLRYWSIAKYYIKQPENIFVEKGEKTSRLIYHKVFQITIEEMKHKQLNRILSWSVFENEDEYVQGNEYLILRKAEWDAVADTQYIKDTAGTEKGLLKQLPKIKGESILLPIDKCVVLAGVLTEFDKIIVESGTPQKRKSEPSDKWAEFDFIRVMDGWTINLNWGNMLECKLLETFYDRVVDKLENLLNGDYMNIHLMALDYFVPIDVFAKYVYGDTRQGDGTTQTTMKTRG